METSILKMLYIFFRIWYNVFHKYIDNPMAYARHVSFQGQNREDAPAAESAPASKKKIPLASLHRASNVYALAALTA
jgi:hypothetical protein